MPKNPFSWQLKVNKQYSPADWASHLPYPKSHLSFKCVASPDPDLDLQSLMPREMFCFVFIIKSPSSGLNGGQTWGLVILLDRHPGYKTKNYLVQPLCYWMAAIDGHGFSHPGPF